MPTDICGEEESFMKKIQMIEDAFNFIEAWSKAQSHEG